MVHLQIVRADGKTVGESQPTTNRKRQRSMNLPALDFSTFCDLPSDSMTWDASLKDARRFVHALGAKMPVAEVQGMCTWRIAGEMLGRILPLVKSFDDLENAARALRLVVRLTLDGEVLGAAMQVSDVIISIHGDGPGRHLDIHMSRGNETRTLRYRIGTDDLDMVTLEQPE